jgi:hypothetical protein
MGKSKLQWRLQEVADARNVQYLLKKVAGKEWTQSRREAFWAVNGKATRMGIPKPVGTHNTLLCARYGGTDFNVCLARVNLALVSLLFSMLLFISFGMECLFVDSMPFYVRSM